MVSIRFLATFLVILVSFSAGSGRFLPVDDLKTGFFGFRRISLREEDLSHAAKVVRVTDFGAKVNGTDDTEAFNKAWNETCSHVGSSVSFVVPKGNYVLKPIRFKGPCKSDTVTVHVQGTVEASKTRSDFDGGHWIVFDEVQQLTVNGGGTLDGNGQVWWDLACTHKRSQPCVKTRPRGIVFNVCSNLVVRDLTVRNSAQMQMTFHNCNNASVSHVTIRAPGNSPNTDGIHITHSQNFNVSNCDIGTGDDCISIESGCSSIRTTNITCGPGHGISIGGLGGGAYVSDVTVDGAKFSGSTNGLRIKTWQGGSGTVKNVKFMNVEMNNVKNPIFIDQHYCDRSQKSSCPEQATAVQVNGVLYRNISGTSATNVAINFDCSKTIHCEGIVLQDINLSYTHKNRHHHHHHDHGHFHDDDDHTVQKAKSSCNNIKFTEIGEVVPNCSGGHPVPPPSPAHHPSHRHHL